MKAQSDSVSNENSPAQRLLTALGCLAALFEKDSNEKRPNDSCYVPSYPASGYINDLKKIFHDIENSDSNALDAQESGGADCGLDAELIAANRVVFRLEDDLLARDSLNENDVARLEALDGLESVINSVALKAVQQRVVRDAGEAAEKAKELSQLRTIRSLIEWDQPRLAANAPAGDPKAKLPKLGDHDMQAWQLSLLHGKTQIKVAEELNKEHGKTYTQGDVSRMIARAKKHADASGLTDLMPGKAAGTGNRTVPVDPAKLEMGKRISPSEPTGSESRRARGQDV